MATPIAALRPQKGAADGDDDSFVQEVVNEIQAGLGTQPAAPPPPPAQPVYYHPPPVLRTLPPLPAATQVQTLTSRFSAPEVRAAAAAAVVAFVLWAPSTQELVDGALERTPARAYKFTAKAALTGALTFLVLQGFRQVM